MDTLLTVALALLISLDRVTPALLLVFTFLASAAAALAVPAWQAVVPQLVGRDKLPQAVALNSVGINIEAGPSGLRWRG